MGLIEQAAMMKAESKAASAEDLAERHSRRLTENAKYDYWEAQLNAVWAELKNANIALKIEQVHKSIASFTSLSKNRRQLMGLDQPVASKVDVKVEDETKSATSIDDEVAALVKKLGANDSASN